MSTLARKARSGARRARRTLVRWAAANELRELEATRAKLRRTRAQLRDARSRLAEATYDLSPEVEEVIERARAEHLSYLRKNDLRELATIVADADANQLPGLIVEAGTARGGSAIVMAAAKAPARGMKVYDVFGMIPAPSEQDGPDVHRRYEKIAGGEAKGVGGDTYYGYRDDLLRGGQGLVQPPRRPGRRAQRRARPGPVRGHHRPRRAGRASRTSTATGTSRP